MDVDARRQTATRPPYGAPPPSAPTFLDVQAAGVVPRGAGSTDAPVGGKLRVTYGYKLLLVMTVMMLMMVARARLLR